MSEFLFDVEIDTDLTGKLHLAPGEKEVNFIVTVSSKGEGPEVISAYSAKDDRGSNLVQGFVIDTSGSMDGSNIEMAKQSLCAAIDELPNDSQFFVVEFNSSATEIVPLSSGKGSKVDAKMKVKRLSATGGTEMSKALKLARSIFSKVLSGNKQLLFLTDGHNNHDDYALSREIENSIGHFQCECRGVGTGWRVDELQQISSALLGSTMIIPSASQMSTEFQKIIKGSVDKRISRSYIRIKAPPATKVLRVEQRYPSIEDITKNTRTSSLPNTFEFDTGNWKNGETRDYHITLSVINGNIGDEMRAAVISIVSELGGQTVDQSKNIPLFAKWTNDSLLFSQIGEKLAHYTGQTQLKKAIDEGLAALQRNDENTARKRFGEAVKIANDSGNTETMQRLKKLVDVQDASTGTVQLKKSVDIADVMEMQCTTGRTVRKEAGDKQ